MGEPRRGGEHLWPHRYPIPVPSFIFLTGTISTMQIFLKLPSIRTQQGTWHESRIYEKNNPYLIPKNLTDLHGKIELP
jgi:hypothetical protein